MVVERTKKRKVGKLKASRQFFSYCLAYKKMSEEGSNPESALVSSIDKELAGLPKKFNEQFIRRTHPSLRRKYEAAYEPERISIGPYHRCKDRLKETEKYKLKYLQGLLSRQKESSVERYIKALMDVEEKARKYYAEDIRLNREDFVKMMLFDGSFIIEFLRKCDNPQQFQKNDPDVSRIDVFLVRDLLLLENQIPFFVLVKLFEMTKHPAEEKDLIRLAICHLYPLITAENPPESSYNIGPEEEIVHLLSLVYKRWCSPICTEEENRSSSSDLERRDFSLITISQQFKLGLFYQRKKEEEPLALKELINSVRELENDGIEFKKAKQSTSWLDIKFENGVMEIPAVSVEDGTESFLRNLITYEQSMHDSHFVSSYVVFMDCLINSSEDVKALRQKGILVCFISNDEELANTFNKFGDGMLITEESFRYKKVFKDVKEYCSKRRNTWRANLRKNYFNSPWSIISFVAATLLLLLTIAQTVFSVLSCVK